MDSTHHMVLGLLFAVVGCCVGSFLNVCAYRVPRGLSVLRPRSRCPDCLTAIRAYDNLPVISWLILRGECRHCGRAISQRYLFIEFAMGLSFVGGYFAEVAITSGDLWELRWRPVRRYPVAGRMDWAQHPRGSRVTHPRDQCGPSVIDQPRRT